MTKLNAALTGVTKLGFDTAPLQSALLTCVRVTIYARLMRCRLPQH
jgi:hypothetical protein